MLTRGYRVVRPRWGRRSRRHPRNMPWWYRCPRAYVGAAHPAKLPAPQGSHYSIAAGERSEPAEGGPHHHRPQGGRTLVVCGCPAPASPRVAALHRLLPWLAVQSVCPFDPLGAVHIYVALLPRVRHAYPRLQSSSAPLGPPSPSPSPQHAVVVSLSSCLLGAAHPAMLPAPQGSHYSITAGERSEPAEGGLPPPSAPRGSNARRVWVSCAVIPSGGCSPPPAAVAGCAERMSVRPPWGRTYICGSPSAGSLRSPAAIE